MGELEHDELSEEAQREVVEVLERKERCNPLSVPLWTRGVDEVDRTMVQVKIAVDDLLLKGAVLTQEQV